MHPWGRGPGGIGITPIRALLEDPNLTGDIVVLYRARTAADAVVHALRVLRAPPRQRHVEAFRMAV